MNRAYINPKGELYQDYKFYTWQICKPVEGIEETKLDSHSLQHQDQSGAVVQNNTRLDFLTR